MIRTLLALSLALALAACPTQPAGDDDTSTLDDDDAWPDDDDSAVPDDDDSAVVETCQDDPMEENDDQASAVPVTVGEFTGLVACPDDEDWFAVELEVGQHLQVDLAFIHADGDIDFRVHAPGGDQLTSATSITDDESAGVTAQEAGLFAVVVYTIDDLGSDYSMTVAVGAAPECPEDELEDNDSSASPATPGAGSWTGLTVCKDDEDWYRFTLAASQVLEVTVAFTSDDGDIDLELLDVGGELVDDSGTIEDIEQISFTAEAAGEYDLRVFIWEWDEAWQTAYDLDVAVH